MESQQLSSSIARLEEKLNYVADKIDKFDAKLDKTILDVAIFNEKISNCEYCSGELGKELPVRVDRLEQQHKNISWWAKTSITAAFFAIAAFVCELIKH